MSHHSYHFVVVQILPAVVVIVVDELLLYQPLMRNFVLKVDRGIMRCLFLNREQGNQKGPDLLFAMAFQCPYDQRLEGRTMYMDLWMMGEMTLGFARMKLDLLLTDLVVNNPRMTRTPDSLRNISTSIMRGRRKRCLTCHSSISNSCSIECGIHVCHHLS